MKATTIAVHWHDDNHPIYSLDFQPHAKNSRKIARRLATAGGDNNVRIWHVQYPKTDGDIAIEYLSTLRKHTQAVNVVRFDPSGNMLASGGDDGLLVIWELGDKIISDFGHQDDEVQESWVARYVYNTSSEIYDLAWAPDSSHIVTGSMDNTAKIYSVQTGQVSELANHSHYVQGVSWDPLNEYLATQSADRSVSVYNLVMDSSPSPALLCKASRAELPMGKLSKSVGSSSVSGVLERTKKSTALYHSETLQSFFRRLAFSPDGSMLLTPSGVFRNQERERGEEARDGREETKEQKNEKDKTIGEEMKSEHNGEEYGHLKEEKVQEEQKDEQKDENKVNIEQKEEKKGQEDQKGKEEKGDGDDGPTSLNTVYIYTRAGLSRAPVCHLPGLAKPAIAISFNPNKYKLSGQKPVFSLPYKMVFAVATQDSVLLYSTEQLQPLGMVSNLHYLTITDLCWERDGSSILVSSAEGFCSAIMFEPGTFGSFVDAEVEVAESGGKPETGPKKVSAPAGPGLSPGAKKSDVTETISTAAQVAADTKFIIDATKPVKTDTKNATEESVVHDLKTVENIQSQAVVSSAGAQNEAVNNGMITQSILDQFKANAFIPSSVPSFSPPVPSTTSSIPSQASETEGPKRPAEPEGQPKKKRIAPTLVEKRE